MNQAENNQSNIAQINQALAEQNKEIISLKSALNEQTDRSLRNTLIFKGIPKDKHEKSWDDTKNTLGRYLSTTFKWDANSLNKDVERAHRGKSNNEDNNKRG